MTNAERIRDMSDEELASWINEILERGIEWFDARACDRCKAENAGRCPLPEDEGCLNIDLEIIDWLKSEADK